MPMQTRWKFNGFTDAGKEETKARVQSWLDFLDLRMSRRFSRWAPA